jgi:uroporphyrin-III C-methyltransferase
MRGKVLLVGAGPGDPELLTLKAAKALKNADVVLHDELVGQEILNLVPRTAEVHNVGKRGGQKSTPQDQINALMVQFALLGLQVVRLKGGDPLIFGRAGEEMEALRRAGIEVEIIPGITAALSAAAAAQIPLTHRLITSTLVILTGHHADNTGPGDWPDRLPSRATIVIYMPGYHYEATAQRLMQAGIEPTTPCVVLSHVTSPEEKVHRTTLEALPLVPRLPAPTLLVVGEVVRYASHESLREEFGWSGAGLGTELFPLNMQSESPARAGHQEQSE